MKTSVIVSFGAMMAFAHAAPSSITARDGDCTTPGENFYKCANGYVGCFAVDPCARTPITTTTSTVLTTPTPKPTATSQGLAACPSGRVMKPVMYNLYPSTPDRSEQAVDQLEVQSKTGEQSLEQVAVFTGIPAGAKGCTLGWVQAAASERTLVVDGSGLVSLEQLSGFPGEGEPVSWASIKSIEEAGDHDARHLHMDFTNWDKIEDATEHTGGSIDCAESVYIKLALDTVNGDGHLYMGQDEKNGLLIDYTC